MDEQEHIANTETPETGSDVDQVETNQAETRTFTQEDVDKIIQNRLKQVEKKYEGIDVDEYRNLKTQQAEEQKKVENPKPSDSIKEIIGDEDMPF